MERKRGGGGSPLLQRAPTNRNWAKLHEEGLEDQKKKEDIVSRYVWVSLRMSGCIPTGLGLDC